jgi:hypothetical protein
MVVTETQGRSQLHTIAGIATTFLVEILKELEIGGPVFASKDAREGPRAFAEKRKPVYRGE